ncbi:STE20/SPS1-related proline-alanine-rich protein kinase [Halocaridina rubra]|uniref:STE20/SPS1-related proline-alanine-rich protein kinase n=1 Tax=Halocaridina rubra TaxID=373956 RepID=A0AAN8WYW3_HALRR
MEKYKILYLFKIQDQYKAYGKSIRKMITDCLQKDPTKRPTAQELLKHPFFKKARDKKYLQSVLLLGGPSIEERVAKDEPFLRRRQSRGRQPGTSGRLHRTQSGDWVWSSDEEGDKDEDGDQVSTSSWDSASEKQQSQQSDTASQNSQQDQITPPQTEVCLPQQPQQNSPHSNSVAPAHPQQQQQQQQQPASPLIQPVNLNQQIPQQQPVYQPQMVSQYPQGVPTQAFPSQYQPQVIGSQVPVQQSMVPMHTQPQQIAPQQYPIQQPVGVMPQQVPNLLPMTGMVQPILAAPLAQGVPTNLPPVTTVPQGVPQVLPQGVPAVLPMAGVPQVMGGVISEGTGAYIASPVQQQVSTDGEPINLVLRVR